MGAALTSWLLVLVATAAFLLVAGALYLEARRLILYRNEPATTLDTLAEALCTHCGHEWRRHDPEDGMCDAHSDERDVFGPCRCGRDIAFHQKVNAALSTTALEALHGDGAARWAWLEGVERG